MRVQIELNTYTQILEFLNKVETVDCDVRLQGFDENGKHWDLSAKSFLGMLSLQNHIKKKNVSANTVDWNTIYCECEKDIYSLIKDYTVQ